VKEMSDVHLMLKLGTVWADGIGGYQEFRLKCVKVRHSYKICEQIYEVGN
jgi:hypothetical protein